EVLVWPGPAPCNATLQACIDAALSGDEVQIGSNGPIAESISFAKSLTLRAAAGYKPVLTAALDAMTPTDANKAGYQIRIEGLTFEVPNGGIEVDQYSPSPLTAEVLGNTINSTYAISILAGAVPGRGPVAFDVSDNTISAGGFGVNERARNSSGRIANNSIAMESSDASGILVDGRGTSAVDVIANRISGTDYGEGISVDVESSGDVLHARILDNLVTGAMSDTNGVGLSLFRTAGSLSAMVVNNTIADNHRGLVATGDIDGLVANNIVSGSRRYGIYIDPTSASSLANRSNLVFDNGEDSFDQGPDTITNDPLFVSNSDYHPQFGSPAIDAGDDSAVPGDLTADLDGSPRIQGSHVN